MKGFLLAASLLLVVPVALAEPVDKVQACMRANIPETVRIQTIEVTAIDRTGGERLLKGRLYGTREKDFVRVMMKVEAPADLAGAAYLVREGEKADEMYIYLPAIRKTRRITGASVDGKLWNTDISYNDLKQVQNAFIGGTVAGEKDAEVDKKIVHVLAYTPRKEDKSRYSKIRAFVDKKTCVPLRVEFYEGGAVRKQLNVKSADVKQSGKRWYASTAEVKDVKDGTRTILKVTGVVEDPKLSDRYFNPQSFHLGG